MNYGHGITFTWWKYIIGFQASLSKIKSNIINIFSISQF